MIINKEWAMPNKNTFEINPISAFVYKHTYGKKETIDPFSNKNRVAKYCNDIDPQYKTEYQLDALDFLKSFDRESIDVVLFDPPYSARQVSECYKSLGMTVNMETTQASFWCNLKIEIQRVLKFGGTALCFGWNSQGIGKTRGFEMKEILLVAHGGHHNDTICTAEIKTEPKQLPLFTEEYLTIVK